MSHSFFVFHLTQKEWPAKYLILENQLQLYQALFPPRFNGFCFNIIAEHAQSSQHVLALWLSCCAVSAIEQMMATIMFQSLYCLDNMLSLRA